MDIVEEVGEKYKPRNWVITVWETKEVPIIPDLATYELLYEEHKDVIRYITAGTEIGPIEAKKVESEPRKHTHVYVELHRAMTMKQMKELFGNDQIHLEKRITKSNQPIIKYTQKGGDFIECGEAMTQGHRTDLSAVAELVKDRRKMIDIVKEHPVEFIKYHSGIEKMDTILLRDEYKEVKRNVNVVVYYGPPGTSKTYMAEGEGPHYKLTESMEKWWDGYEGQELLIIDDFRGWIKFSTLLNILDQYPFCIQIKYGFTYARWTKVIITTNTEPEQWYPYAKDIDKKALMRRIHTIETFDKVYDKTKSEPVRKNHIYEQEVNNQNYDI